jgi:hypothetical protein
MNPRHFPDKKNQRWRKRAETLFTSTDPSVCYCADAQIGIEVWRVSQLTAVNPRVAEPRKWPSQQTRYSSTCNRPTET